MAVEKDIVLIYFEDNPLTYARIEAIKPDVKRDWYHVTLLLLQIPLQVVTWILRDAYINGAPFTMNGKQMRLERVVAPDDSPTESGSMSQKAPPVSGKVISLADLKKK